MPSGTVAAFNRGLNASWPHLILFTVYLLYVFAGGGLFLVLEGGAYEDHTKDDVHSFLALRQELGEAIRNASRGMESMSGNLTDLWETYLTSEKTLGRCDYYDNTTMGWTFTGSVLFCVTTIATIGYGDATPVTPAGRAAIVIYSLIGIPLTLTFLADIGGLLARIVIAVVAWCRCRAAKTNQTTAVQTDIEKASAVDGVEPPQRDRSSTRSALNEDGNLMDMRMSLGIFQDSSDPVRGSLPCSRRNSINDETPEQERMGSGFQNLGFTKETNSVEETKTSKKTAGTNKETGETSEAEDENSNVMVQKHVPVIVVTGILIVYTLVGALMIAEVENWNYGDALYFTFVTLTTIGFGDFVPVKHYMDIPSFFGCMIYTICGLSVMSMCLALVQAKVVMLMSRMAAKVGF